MTGLAFAAMCQDLAKAYHFDPAGDGEMVTKHPYRTAWVVSLLDELVGEFAQFEVDARAVAGYQDEATAALVARQFRRARGQVDARVSFEPDVTYEASPAPKPAPSRFMSRAYGGWR